MVVLVTGASGQLGQALQALADKYPEIKFHFTTSNETDITNQQALYEIFKETKPDYCINAAAYTAVDKAESEPEKARLVNLGGATNLAAACKVFQSILIHISTDFVFDGNKKTPYLETDDTNPQGVYGLTKRDAELAIIENSQAYFIIRTSWLYSQFGNNFMKTMLRLAGERETLSIVNDQIGTPTNANDLAEFIVTIMESNSNAYGIYHFSNEGRASWYDFAKKIFELNDVGITLKPIPTAGFPTPAKRPKFSVLDKEKAKRTFDVSIPHWEQSLESLQSLS